jgi:hypothetical protein
MEPLMELPPLQLNCPLFCQEWEGFGWWYAVSSNVVFPLIPTSCRNRIATDKQLNYQRYVKNSI